MSEQSERQGAVIIPFPGRKGGKGPASRDGASMKDRLPAHVAVCEFGSGWYHDAAMQDEARRRAPR